MPLTQPEPVHEINLDEPPHPPAILLPAHRMAYTVAFARVARGEDIGPNIAGVLLLAIIYLGDLLEFATTDPEPGCEGGC